MSGIEEKDGPGRKEACFPYALFCLLAGFAAVIAACVLAERGFNGCYGVAGVGCYFFGLAIGLRAGEEMAWKLGKDAR